MNRIERIEAAENAMDQARSAVDQLQEAVAAQAVALDALRQVADYYGSQDWYDDRRADELGKLPHDLARGVLTEDAPYDVLVDAREAALGALEVAAAMLRAL